VPNVQTAERIARYKGIQPEEVSLFRWRGEGWPGATVVEARDGRKAAMSYVETWYTRGVPWTYDMQFRCKICPDAIGEHADVSAPDGWLMDGSRRLFDDAPGVNIAIGRTRRGEELLAAAKSAGALVLEPFDRDALDATHADHKPRKQEYLARRIGVALAGQPIPKAPGVRALKNAWAAGLLANLRAFGGAFRRVLVGRNREPLA
jgi:coenzyme F420 hydrogenase subunit beta